MSENSFETILASMVSGGDYTEALKSIARLNQVVAKKSEAVDQNDEGIGEYDGESIVNYNDVANLMNVAQTMGDIIYNYERYLDRKLLPEILSNIEGNIRSESLAIRAIYHYDGNWFKHTPVSANAKSQIAQKLLSVCNRYYKYDMGLWQSLADNNIATGNALTYKYNGDV